MQYRTIPNTNRKVSALGFGCLRLPSIQTEKGKMIDHPEAIRIIRHAIDNGVSYVDTAYTYNDGDSEALVGEALRNGYREKVTLATKLPCGMVRETADMERFFDEQRRRLQTDSVDVYLLHSLDGAQFDRMVKLGALEFLDRLKKEGKIRLAGFSFHGDKDAFMRILDSYPWDVCQIQMNILDEFQQATMDGARKAAKRGIGVIVMEPLRGGGLAQRMPQEVEAIYAGARARYSGVEWAFRWLLDKPEFCTILSGMSDFAQVEDNLRIFDTWTVGNLQEGEPELLASVREAYYARMKIGCTECNYCQHCPQGIAISQIFRGYNRASMFNTMEAFRERYRQMKVKADACIHCRKCVAACPQHFATPIPDMLQAIHAEMTK